MDESDLEVILRDFNQDQDQAYIYASWRNQAFYSAPNRKERTYSEEVKLAREAFRKSNELIKGILPQANVKIACLKSAPFVIIGYSVSRGSHLDFIYVKSEYRNKGIGSLLLPKNIETVAKDVTELGNLLAKKKNFKEK